MGEARLFEEGRGLFEVNPSKLQCYLDCPRQYRFRYVDRRRERRTFGSTSLGRSVHQALRDFYGLEPAERTLEELLRALRRAWDASGYRSRRERENAFARAEDMLRTYYGNADPERVRPIALESKFSHARSSDAILVTGRVDRLDLDDDDEYVIVDYKTGRFGTDQEAVASSLPLSLYAIAASAVLMREVSRIVIESLPTGTRAETTRDPARLDGDWKALVDIVDEIRGEATFEPTPSALCQWCDYLTACPEGQASLTVPNEPQDAPPPDGPG